jgi:L-threonylcarbamoyladenylate synthase
MPQVSFLELVAAGQSGDRLISFPTDTVPALAVRPDCAKQIYAAKQRSETKPLILMAATADDLWGYVSGSAAEQAIWAEVAAAYWPGALTLVLPASDRLPPQVNPMNPTTIGIRVPNRAIARQILAQTGALATTSINRSGAPPLLTIEAINTEFPEVLTLSPGELMALEPEERSDLQSGVPSTVAKWEHDGWVIVRQGVVTL